MREGVREGGREMNESGWFRVGVPGGGDGVRRGWGGGWVRGGWLLVVGGVCVCCGGVLGCVSASIHLSTIGEALENRLPLRGPEVR